MSQHQENGAPLRAPPNSHPEPPSYPSPPMQPSYAYPPPQGQAGNEPYRQSPTGSNMPILPPIRGIDGQAQPPTQPPPPQGAQQLPPGQPIPPYPYPPQSGQPMIPGQMGHYPPQRYALPAQNADARMMSGGRHKKEIKRRTKTGCLTCRKRRIKCDEQHPKCRNCIKSKRECLGYDPIFKQQQAPTQLQPAPSASPSSSASAPTAGATSSYPPSSAPYHPVSNGTSLPPATSSSVKQEPSQPYEFGSAIDPALAGGGSGAMASYGGSQFRPPTLVPCRIEDLWYFQGHRPTDVPPNAHPLPQELLDEIRDLYIREFAPGCDSIMETDWYSRHGLEVLLSNMALCQMMSELIKHYKYIGTGQNFAVENKCRVFEIMALWKLLCLSRITGIKPENGTNGTSSSIMTPALTLDELNKRLDVIEALLTNSTLPSNPLNNVKYPDSVSSGPSPKARQLDFWRQVGNFVSAPSDDASGQAHTAVSSCRNLLDMHENRDVIYSIMVCRHLGRRFQGFPDHMQGGRPEGGELDDGNKVIIARDFITNEANWKGTTHPIQRLCDMAIRSWTVRPEQRP